jgi:signal transduction histidine kinase
MTMSKTNGTHRPELEALSSIDAGDARGSNEPLALLRSIGDVMPSHLALLDREGTIRGVNRCWRDFAPKSWLALPDPGVGSNYLAICDAVRGKHAADARAIAAAIRDAIAGTSSRRRIEYECGEPDHEQSFELCVVALPRRTGGVESSGDEVSVLVSHRDTTDARIAKRRLEESLGQVRRFACHLQDASEQERRSIAREMHDELGHQLTALKIDLVSLERELQRQSSGLAARASSMKTLFDQVIGSVRRLSSELRPGILDDFGLVAAIEWQAEAFEERTGIAAEVILEADDHGLSAPLQTAVFRVLQESLANVARHARADHVQIVLRRGPTELRLEVRDNGAGFEPQKLREPMSFGLTGMRERVLALGGAFRVDGLLGYGTTVSATVPLATAESGEPALAIAIDDFFSVGPSELANHLPPPRDRS